LVDIDYLLALRTYTKYFLYRQVEYALTPTGKFYENQAHPAADQTQFQEQDLP